LIFTVRYLGVMPKDITIMATQADFDMIITVLQEESHITETEVDKIIKTGPRNPNYS
jgi:hypothetical protein